MQLTHELAQEIVDRTIPIIHHNINLFDESGLIIASGEKDRLLTFHSGALEVVKQSKPIEIRSNKSLPVGTKPGINLPIYFQDRLMGVVGITGEPEEIRPFGEIVKLHVEMMMQQAFLLKEIEKESKAKDHLVMDLISGNLKTEHEINNAYARASILNLNLKKTGIIVLLQVSPTSQFTKSIEELEQYKVLLNEELQSYVEQKQLIHLFSQISYDQFLLVLPITSSLMWSEMKMQVKGKIEHLIRTLPKLTSVYLYFGVGKLVQDITDYPESYRQSKFSLFIKHTKPEHQITFFDQIGIRELLMSIKPIIKETYRKETIGKLVKHPKLMQTLQAFIKKNRNITKVADELNIQRITVMNRLEKITELTNRDPRKLEDLLELYVGIKIEE